MAITEIDVYQNDMCTLLRSAISGETVATEWGAMRDEPTLYSPRLDLAVGPFATRRILIQRYNELCAVHQELLEALFRAHCENIASHGFEPNSFSYNHVISRNRNARCFLAIEIENRVSHKHLMGGAINAAALGRIGLAIAWTDTNLIKFLRLRNYLLFLTAVGKNSFDPSNLLILTAAQLRDALNAYLESDA